MTHNHDPKAAFEQGKSDAVFDGVDTSGDLPCTCEECIESYYKGMDAGMNELLKAVAK